MSLNLGFGTSGPSSYGPNGSSGSSFFKKDKYDSFIENDFKQNLDAKDYEIFKQELNYYMDINKILSEEDSAYIEQYPKTKDTILSRFSIANEYFKEKYNDIKNVFQYKTSSTFTPYSKYSVNFSGVNNKLDIGYEKAFTFKPEIGDKEDLLNYIYSKYLKIDFCTFLEKTSKTTAYKYFSIIENREPDDPITPFDENTFSLKKDEIIQNIPKPPLELDQSTIETLDKFKTFNTEEEKINYSKSFQLAKLIITGLAEYNNIEPEFKKQFKNELTKYNNAINLPDNDNELLSFLFNITKDKSKIPYKWSPESITLEITNQELIQEKIKLYTETEEDAKKKKEQDRKYDRTYFSMTYFIDKIQSFGNINGSEKLTTEFLNDLKEKLDHLNTTSSGEQLKKRWNWYRCKIVELMEHDIIRQLKEEIQNFNPANYPKKGGKRKTKKSKKTKKSRRRRTARKIYRRK